MDNVFTLIPTKPQKREVNPDLIAGLHTLLERLEAGEVKSIAASYTTEDENVHVVVDGENMLELLGMIEFLKKRYFEVFE
jgi:hypothetical protein